MGAKCCKNDNYRAEMLSEIQNFNFNDNYVELPLESRVIRELMLDTRTVYQLQICLKKFLLENAYLIKEQNIRIEGKGIESRISAPPLLDQVWQMAILYSQNYIKICKKLVGCIIDREYSQQNIHKKILKKMLPEYDDKMYQIEYEYTIWIKRNDLEKVIQYIHSLIIEEEKISFESILQIMMQIKIILCDQETKKQVTRKIQDKNISDVYKKIQTSIPSDLELILMHKYCLSQQLAKIYIDEYCHYMTMLKFTKYLLVPSEEIDQVWHTHQCMTKQYRQFCMSIFDRFIYHNPTNKSNNQQQIQDFYQQTLQQYQKFFNYPPDPQVWPSLEDRWNPLNFLGSWVNLFRLCMSIIQVIQDRLQPTSANILTKYQQWKGTNVFKNVQEIEIKKSDINLSTQIQTERYWDVGCYALTELEEDRFYVSQKNEMFFDDDVIINSIK